MTDTASQSALPTEKRDRSEPGLKSWRGKKNGGRIGINGMIDLPKKKKGGRKIPAVSCSHRSSRARLGLHTHFNLCVSEFNRVCLSTSVAASFATLLLSRCISSDITASRGQILEAPPHCLSLRVRHSHLSLTHSASQSGLGFLSPPPAEHRTPLAEQRCVRGCARSHKQLPV